VEKVALQRAGEEKWENELQASQQGTTLPLAVAMAQRQAATQNIKTLE